MPINTIDTYLLQGTGTGSITYSKLVDIKDYSDLYGEKEELEVTTLSDKKHKYIAGIQAGDRLDFTCNYTYSDFSTIKALDDGAAKNFRLAFGKGGTDSATTYGQDGYFDFTGYISVRILGKGVNEVREMVVTIIINSDITAGQTTA